jgi:hypothetical protein
VEDVAKDVEREVGGAVASEEEVARKKGERSSVKESPLQGQLSSSKL